MKQAFCSLILFLSLMGGIVSAQHADTVSLKQAAQALDKALMAKDTIVLKRLLHASLRYGHSNAWLETKQELLDNLLQSKMSYEAIEPLAGGWLSVAGPAGLVGRKADFKVLLGTTVVQVRLSVMEMWLWEQGRWQLIGRQSVKTE